MEHTKHNIHTVSDKRETKFPSVLRRTSQKGQAMITAAIFFLLASIIITGGITTPVFRAVVAVGDLYRSKESYYLAEAALEDAVLRTMKAYSVGSSETLSFNDYTAEIQSSDASGVRTITAKGVRDNYIRSVRISLQTGEGITFHYGMQSDQGGVVFENNSTVRGNLYSNGSVTGGGNIVKGDVISAGPSGLVNGIHATSSMYAHTIQNSTVDKDAYYQSISNSTVSGVSYPNSPDQATSSLPISDAQIAKWEDEALSGGAISSPCPYKITEAATIGPTKISCDLEIDTNDEVVLLGGPVWVEGNITIKGNSIIKVNPSLGSASVALIADKQSNRSASSKVIVMNNTEFQSSGTNGSYSLLISMNTSSKNGGSEVAIEGQNNVDGALLIYAPYGEILIHNNIKLKEVTGYKIRLKNNAEVVYETGLANLLFSSGPSGGYTINSWKEVVN